MKHSTDRILTTHCGSLARPKDLLDLMKAKVIGEPYDEGAYTSRVRSAVAETVRNQVEIGIDVVTDGELGKSCRVRLRTAATRSTRFPTVTASYNRATITRHFQKSGQPTRRVIKYGRCNQ